MKIEFSSQIFYDLDFDPKIVKSNVFDCFRCIDGFCFIKFNFHFLIKSLKCNMSIEDSSSGGMIKFITTNFTFWKPWMENLINCKDLFDPLDAKENNLNPTKKTKWKKLNKKTISEIHYVVQEIDTYAF